MYSPYMALGTDLTGMVREGENEMLSYAQKKTGSTWLSSEQIAASLKLSSIDKELESLDVPSLGGRFYDIQLNQGGRFN